MVQRSARRHAVLLTLAVLAAGFGLVVAAPPGRVAAAPPCVTGQVDPLDGVDDNCDGRDGTVAKSVLVSQSGTDAPGCGSAAAPCQTIGFAQYVALGQNRFQLLVAAGTYPSFSILKGLEIGGGYDPVTWTRSGGTTTVTGSWNEDFDATVAIVADRVDSPTRLYGLRVQGAPAGPGQASYGILMRNGTTAAFKLDTVTVIGGTGGAGSNGTNGTSPVGTVLTGSGGADAVEIVDTCNNATAPAGGAGAPGSGAGAGGRGGPVDTSCGFPPNWSAQAGSNGANASTGGAVGGTGGAPEADGGCSGPRTTDGQTGGAGANGANGARGANGVPSIGSFVDNRWTAGTSGGTGALGANGHPGAGGGGGGASDCGSDDTGAGGGGGGAGGLRATVSATGGTAGHASIGILLADSSPTFNRTTVTLGAGGKGGNGGHGAPGLPGGAGGPGGQPYQRGGRGGDGGKGGNGGASGPGGAGPGGPAIGIALTGASSPVNLPQTTGGTGGSGGDLGSFLPSPVFEGTGPAGPVVPVAGTPGAVAYDFGDAPASYGTAGASAVRAGFSLGTTWTAEASAATSPTATGDTGDDGVTVPLAVAGAQMTFTVNLTNTAQLAQPTLRAWVDWNRDGDWADDNERIALDVPLKVGSNAIKATVPADVTPGTTFARFRLSSGFGVLAEDKDGPGEVEDHAVTIVTGVVADAGPDRTVRGGAPVTLDGSGSHDPQGDPITYAWTQTAGPTVSLTGATTAQPTFTAPNTSTTLTFRLQVSDGTNTSTDTVTITVNAGPVADAGPDQTVDPGASVQLDASGSSDPEGDPLDFVWTRLSGPVVSLSDATAARPTFTAPAGPATITFQVTVFDGGSSATDTVDIRVNGGPVADAGPDQVVDAGATATLDGRGSTDPEGDPLTFAWVQIAGGPVTLNNATTAQPSFTVPAGSGSRTFQLTVTDGRGLSGTDTVVVATNTPPSATSRTVPVRHASPTSVTLTGTDPEGQALTFATTSSPLHGSLSGTAPNLTYTPTVGFVGTDSFTFTASDGTLSSTGTITLEVTNAAPSAVNATVAVATGAAKAITLTGSDPDGNVLTYSVTSGPEHGTITGTAPTLTYTPAAGYLGPDSFGFQVSDGIASANGTISITVSGAVPGAPTLAAPTPAEGEVTLSWATPSDDGGSAITGYRIDWSRNGVTQSPITVPATPRTHTVTGLTNGIGHTFRVSAVNAVGTGPASNTSATVTPRWWLPWSSGTAAVNDLYTWFTGKAPTAAQRTAALNSLNAGTTKPGDLVAALRVGADATTNVDPATRLYAAYFVRIPDAGGLNYWIGKRRNGTNLNATSSSFAASSEFKNRYGTLSNRAFVELVYQNVLGRPGDAGGINYWTGRLDRKASTRGQVMVGFSESNEYKRTQVNNLHAAVVYIHLLGRAPSIAERDAFVAELVDGTPLATLVRQLIHTPALANRAN